MNSQISLSAATHQNIPIKKLLQAKKVLLLQGPIGPFFQKFALWLQHHQIEVSKVNFNGGDWWYSRHINNCHNFALPFPLFHTWLCDLITSQNIDALVCFGDCRPQHQIAKKVCRLLGLDFFVFEEGYIRPDYITFEYEGVNAHSVWALSDTPMLPIRINPPHDANQKFIRMVGYAINYYLAMAAGRFWFPGYCHHRNLPISIEMLSWLKSGIRKITYKSHDQATMALIQQNFADRYFVCALQVFNDFQIRAHSDYHDVTEFIEEVIHSFAQHSHHEDILVFKHHPMDRGYRNYKKFIYTLSSQLKVSERIYYVCDVHLPTLIEHSLGMVTINSTTGIQSLFRHKPVKVMGRAIYKHPGITAQISLDDFWRDYASVDMSKYDLFKNNLIYFTQLNGSFYGDMPWMTNY